jgi:hypothetical protein
MLLPTLQAGQTGHVVQQVAQCAHVAIEQAQEVAARQLGSIRGREACGCVRDHAQVSPQVVCGLLPELSAVLFQLAQRLEGVLQVPDVAVGLELLQPEILRGARANGGAVLLRPDPAGRRHHGAIELRVRNRVAVEFDHDTFVELRQLARDLCQVEPLLPSLQTVGRGISLLHLLGVLDVCRLGSAAGGEPLLEVEEERGNVVVKLGAGKRRTGGQRGIGRHRFAPRLQDGSASLRDVCGQGRELRLTDGIAARSSSSSQDG